MVRTLPDEATRKTNEADDIVITRDSGHPDSKVRRRMTIDSRSHALVGRGQSAVGRQHGRSCTDAILNRLLMPQLTLFDAGETLLADDYHGRIAYTPCFMVPRQPTPGWRSCAIHDVRSGG